MPVPDVINPLDPDLYGPLSMGPISVPLAPIGRGTYISLTAEAITGKPQGMLWPTPVGSFATFPKPDNRIRLYRGKTRTVVPEMIFNDALPEIDQLSGAEFYRFLYEIGNLQRLRWLIDGITPENITPVPQEASLFGKQDNLITSGRVK
jgi:hypothetical protein